LLKTKIGYVGGFLGVGGVPAVDGMERARMDEARCEFLVNGVVVSGVRGEGA